MNPSICSNTTQIPSTIPTSAQSCNSPSPRLWPHYLLFPKPEFVQIPVPKLPTNPFHSNHSNCWYQFQQFPPHYWHSNCGPNFRTSHHHFQTIGSSISFPLPIPPRAIKLWVNSSSLHPQTPFRHQSTPTNNQIADPSMLILPSQ